MTMDTTRRGIVTSALVLSAALMFAGETQAQPPEGRGFDGPAMRGGPGGMFPGLKQLSLTDAQDEAIRKIADQNRDDGRALAEQLRAARGLLAETVMAEVVNESAIRARAAEVAALEADSAVQRAHVNAQIWAVIAPDQRAELREIQADLKVRVAERRARLGRRAQRR
jgi:Spy/CpxP family protein refolding chaperone